MDVNNRFMKFFTGDFSRQFAIRHLLPLLLGLFFGGILIANVWFPALFDWRYLTISELMNPILNPAGRYFLSVGMIACGILLVPAAGYVYRKLNIICRNTAKAGFFFMLMGITGLILVGLIPDTDELDPIHQAAAAMTACGLILSYLCWWVIMRKDRQPKHCGKRQFDRCLMIAGIILMWFAIIGMLLSQSIRLILQGDLSYTGIAWMSLGFPAILSIALWEWIFFLIINFYLVLLILMIPDVVVPLETRTSSPT